MQTFTSSHTYAGGSFDRLGERSNEPGWLDPMIANARAMIVPFHEDRPAIAIGNNGGARAHWRPLDPSTLEHDYDEPLVLLGLEGGAPRFAATLSSAPADEDGVKWIDIRSLGVQGLLAPDELSALGQARALLDWHANHKHCAKCGAKTRSAAGGFRRLCPACSAEHYPRVNPVVIVVVTCDGHLLLGRSPHFPPLRYSALAGFMEPGESIAEAARREILEEAGVTVTALHYHSDQPWPFPSSLMIGCVAEAATLDIEVDRTELEDARWFPVAEARQILEGTHPDGLNAPPPFAIAHHLIRAALVRAGETG